MPPPSFQKLDAFSRIAVAIFLEAAPFLLLGALISAVISVYVNQAGLVRLVPRNRFLNALIGLGAGMVLPVCECGSVPVARRLLEKGIPPQLALTYMLAAPVINPLVLVSTYIAFRGDLSLPAGRGPRRGIPCESGWHLLSETQHRRACLPAHGEAP